jgi:DNA invertase Pin-like site-specific DNA recombinase
MTSARRAALYVRVSRDHQVAGESLDAQIAELLRFADYMQLEVPDYLIFREEGVSGAKASRPQLDTMLATAQRHEFEELLVWKVSRFGRSARNNLDLLHQLEEFGVGVRFVKDGLDASTPANRALVIPVLSGVAELELENIRDQSRLGKRASAAKGKWQGGEPPFGTRPVPAPDGRGQVLEANPAEAQAIRDVYRWIVEEDLSAYEATRRLNGAGVRTRRGLRWTHQNLRHLLRNRRLTGHATFSDIAIAVPQLLTEAEFEALQRALSRFSATHRVKGRRNHYPLSGLLICGCGAHWIGAGSRGKRHYRCSRNDSALAAHERCDWRTARWIQAEPVEDAVWGELCRVLADPEQLLAAAEAYTTRRDEEKPVEQDQIARVQRLVAVLEAAETRIIGDYAKKDLPASAVAQALAEIDGDLQAARAHLRVLEQWAEHNLQQAQKRSQLGDLAMKARSWLTNADPVQRRQVMELLELKVSIIDRAHYEITGSVPLDDLVAVKTASPGRD